MSEKHNFTPDRSRPPPLPPRAPSHSQNAENIQTSSTPPESEDAPPSYDSIFTREPSDVRPPLGAADPRTSSTQSLKPVRLSGEQSDKRRLLLIYIHGFMGNETSFQSFPAHVHHLAAALLAESHTVHTKVYPRYRSKKNITFARDDFSGWLAPHESSLTDVILLGHSMGGLVSAEVALSQVDPSSPLRHRILGTINFDVPFLGMHPSVIKSGLASIFSPAPGSPAASPTPTPAASFSDSGNASTAGHSSEPPALPPRRPDTLFNPQQAADPNYNPHFDNDVALPVRTGWRSAWHFVNKHSDDLLGATKQLVKSHMEFGGAMADYSGLKNRYCRIRALEEASIEVRSSVMSGSWGPPRVRFVNYYTSSTGRPKKPKTPAATPGLGDAGALQNLESASSLSLVQTQDSASAPTKAATPPEEDTVPSEPKSQSPLIMVDKVEDDIGDPSHYDLEESNDALGGSLSMMEPLPMSDYDEDESEEESWADAVEDVHISNDNPVSLEETADTHTASAKPTEPAESSAPSSNPLEESTSVITTTSSLTSDPSLSLSITASTLPPIPDAPPRPAEPDFSAYVDKATRKLAEKDYARTLKTWERAVKDRERAIRDREKLEEKRQRQAIKDGKRAERESDKEAKRLEKEAERMEKEAERVARLQDKQQHDSHESVFEIQRRETEKEWKEALNMKWNDEDGTVTPMDSSSMSRTNTMTTTTTNEGPTPSLSSIQKSLAAQEKANAKANLPPREHTFCSLPPKDASGNRDPTWIKVFMPDVDEVGAHCGLFFETSPAYEQLVGEVGEKIAEWVGVAEGERVAGELEEGVD
ncbi:hypothetical protein AAFC00_004589 [Neodothiora populina]|uniref:AB hydrolase-1 domain-containing protein n=1 Tax=Neodothiora populina TaxID=2781224 RepID=A0ABR3P2Q9_9PEZI